MNAQKRHEYTKETNEYTKEAHEHTKTLFCVSMGLFCVYLFHVGAFVCRSHFHMKGSRSVVCFSSMEVTSDKFGTK